MNKTGIGRFPDSVVLLFYNPAKGGVDTGDSRFSGAGGASFTCVSESPYLRTQFDIRIENCLTRKVKPVYSAASSCS